MGIVDAFNPEDRIQVTKRELFDLMLNKAKLMLLTNGLKNNVSSDNLLKVLDVEVENNEP